MTPKKGSSGKDRIRPSVTIDFNFAKLEAELKAKQLNKQRRIQRDLELRQPEAMERRIIEPTGIEKEDQN